MEQLELALVRERKDFNERCQQLVQDLMQEREVRICVYI